MEYINRNPKIFVLSGKASSGKDLVADIIKGYYNNKKCKKLSYAYYLKQYVKDITGWSGDDSDKPRDFLQDFGINFLKKDIDKNFLINRLCEDVKVYSFFYDVLIITDARLLDEIETIKKGFNNVTTIRINRLLDNHLTETQKSHITETDLDNYDKFDFIIENNDNYDKLVESVSDVLEVAYE